MDEKTSQICSKLQYCKSSMHMYGKSGGKRKRNAHHCEVHDLQDPDGECKVDNHGDQ